MSRLQKFLIIVCSFGVSLFFLSFSKTMYDTEDVFHGFWIFELRSSKWWGNCSWFSFEVVHHNASFQDDGCCLWVQNGMIWSHRPILSDSLLTECPGLIIIWNLCDKMTIKTVKYLCPTSTSSQTVVVFLVCFLVSKHLLLVSAVIHSNHTITSCSSELWTVRVSVCPLQWASGRSCWRRFQLPVACIEKSLLQGPQQLPG